MCELRGVICFQVEPGSKDHANGLTDRPISIAQPIYFYFSRRRKMETTRAASVDFTTIKSPWTES
eukprot:scaffold1064_cov85-Amphora_coffeaeformis.AAC.5